MTGSPPWGIWRAQSYDLDSPSELKEARGNGRNTWMDLNGGSLTKTFESGNLARNSVHSINGGLPSNHFLLWPHWPYEFTICTMTRYTSSTSTNQGLVFSNFNSGYMWAHGHYYERGVAFYNGYNTASTNSGTSTDWLVMCGQNSLSNSSAPPYNIIMSGRKNILTIIFLIL